MALFHLARLTEPAMVKAGEGALIVTADTSAQRGKAAFAGFAPTKAAQRILAESLARDLGPKGVHVAYLVIGAAIDVPWQRKRRPHAKDDFFISPASIAGRVLPFLAGMGLVKPIATAIALEPFGDRAGIASALLGFLQMGCAALGTGLEGSLPQWRHPPGPRPLLWSYLCAVGGERGADAAGGAGDQDLPYAGAFNAASTSSARGIGATAP